MKIKEWIETGEFNGNEEDFAAVIETAGYLLDDNYVGDILGQPEFVA